MSSPALRDTLRLALTVAVVNGFASLTGLAFAIYASMAVLSVTVGNYGNTLELGRQRLVGTAVGAIVVFFGYRGWGTLPVVVALPLALLLARLIAGSLRLTVGYTVCCFVVISGWLTHEQQLDSWIPLRLFWTAFGILMALLSLRLFWPSTARLQQRQGLLQLLVDLGHTLQESLQQASAAERRRTMCQRLRTLRQSLLNLRTERVGALRELGPLASRHPVAQIWELLEHACESLMLDLDDSTACRIPSGRAWDWSTRGPQPTRSVPPWLSGCWTGRPRWGALWSCRPRRRPPCPGCRRRFCTMTRRRPPSSGCPPSSCSRWLTAWWC